MATGPRETMSIWFFCGAMLLAYGLIICATGVWELSHPLQNPPALADLKAPIWWGGLLAVAGLAYVIRFFPRRRPRT